MTELEDSKIILLRDKVDLDATIVDVPEFKLIGADDKKERVVHLDKWLWAACFFKTRELAISAISAGAVTYNYDTTYHNQAIYIGDVITIKYDKNTKTVNVTGLSTRRRNMNDASQLYKEEHKNLHRSEFRGNRYYKRNHKQYNKSANHNKKQLTKENTLHNTTKEEPNYNRTHSQSQFPSDFSSSHFLDRAQEWYDEPDFKEPDN